MNKYLFGVLNDEYLFSTHSYQITKDDGSIEFTKPKVNQERLESFQNFCKKNNIKRRTSCADLLGKNMYHIFEGYYIFCGSEQTYSKLKEHLQDNIPLKRGRMAYVNDSSANDLENNKRFV